MARYNISGAAGAASVTAATAGIVKVDATATILARAKIYEFGVYPGATAADSNYSIQVKSQTTAGTWTSVTPAPLDPQVSASKSTGGRASTAAGTADTVLGIFGFNQRGGFRWVAVPGSEFWMKPANSAGIIVEYIYAQDSGVNYGAIFFEE